MRIATYNVEWFNFLFDERNVPIFDDEPSKRYKTTRGEQLAAIGAVFQALDADAVLIIEAPDTAKTRSTVEALENFAAEFKLRANRAVVGYKNQTQQQIALLFDPTKLDAEHDPKGGSKPLTPEFDGMFHLDVNVDGAADTIRFSKPPLEVALITAEGRKIRLVGVHAKSKAPYGAKNKDEENRISIENRRKQLAQCIWVRHRVEEHLAEGEDVIVLGDFNDGPGLDEFERLFGRSGVEIVLGEDGENCLYDPHARMGQTRRFGGLPTTSRFYIPREKRYLGALLDYIMVSARLRPIAREWRIWHPFEDPQIYHAPLLREALLTASDHFPVTLDLEI